MSAYLRLLRQKLNRANALLAADKTTYVGVGILVPKPLNLLTAALLLLYCCFTAAYLPLLYCYFTATSLLLYCCFTPLLLLYKTIYAGVGILVPKPLTSPAEVATRVPTNGVLSQTLSTAALLIPSEAATNTLRCCC